MPPESRTFFVGPRVSAPPRYWLQGTEARTDVTSRSTSGLSRWSRSLVPVVGLWFAVEETRGGTDFPPPHPSYHRGFHTDTGLGALDVYTKIYRSFTNNGSTVFYVTSLQELTPHVGSVGPPEGFTVTHRSISTRALYTMFGSPLPSDRPTSTFGSLRTWWTWTFPALV